MSNVSIAGNTVSGTWPSAGLQAFNYVALVLAQLILAALIGNRFSSIWDVLTRPDPHRPSWWARFYLALVFAFSCLFTVLGGLLQFGIGTSSIAVCETAIISCILVYGLAKLSLYLFLNERAWIVRETARPKFKTWFYPFNLLAISLGPVCVVLNLVGRVARLDEGNACHIGLSQHFSIPFLAWDALITLYLTFLFVRPLLGQHVSSPQLRRLAVVSLICALAALTSSVANLIVLTILRTELTFLCLSICPLDIACNALILAGTTRERDKLDSWTESQTAAASAVNSRKPPDTTEGGMKGSPTLLSLQAMLTPEQVSDAPPQTRRPSAISLLGVRRISSTFEKTSAPTSPWEQVKLSPLEEAALNAPIVVLSKDYGFGNGK